MGKKYQEIPDNLHEFIAKQKMFFVATTDIDGRINLSPKGLDSLRIINKNRVVWLNATGSGNETAAHMQNQSRMTIMFNSFDEKPMILRLYGHAKAVHHNDKNWDELYALFPPITGPRQIFDLEVDLVHTSCGFGVPLYEYQGQRQTLSDWSDKKGEEGIRQYWADKNQVSLDGKSIDILDKNL